MANKEFQVRHGLIVGNTANVLVANTITTNVGIGTITPGYKLDVVGSANAAQYYVNGTLATEISNSFASATITGANTAVGNGANNYLLAVIGGANTAVGTGANTYLSEWANSKFIANNVSDTAVFGGNVFISGLATIGSATSNVYLGDTWVYANLGTALANSNSGFIINQTWNNASNNFTAFTVNVANTNSGDSSLLADFKNSNYSVLNLTKNGVLTLNSPISQGSFVVKGNDGRTFSLSAGADLMSATGGLQLNRTNNFLAARNINGTIEYFAWASSVSSSNVGIVEQRPTTDGGVGFKPQTYRLYNHYFDSANNNRLAIQWQANTINISSEALGNGVIRPIAFTMNTSTVMYMSNTGNVLINRTTDSTLGQNVKLDIAGSVNARSYFANGVPLTGGATGGGTDDIFYENSQNVNSNYTITTNKNAMSTGPITIKSGVTVTVPSGSRWVVI